MLSKLVHNHDAWPAFQHSSLRLSGIQWHPLLTPTPSVPSDSDETLPPVICWSCMQLQRAKHHAPSADMHHQHVQHLSPCYMESRAIRDMCCSHALPGVHNSRGQQCTRCSLHLLLTSHHLQLHLLGTCSTTFCCTISSLICSSTCCSASSCRIEPDAWIA